MAQKDRWLLPEGIEDLLPEQATRLEKLRRALLDTFSGWGYELVIPSLVEYLDSLYVGAGNDLGLQTFKLIDQLTGRLMGLRADMTPQVARIDNHRLKRDHPVRLCYYGAVLLTQVRELGGSRCPLQVGAELFGHRGVESDIEILQLMIEAMKITGIDRPYIDLGHVAIFRGLVRQAGLSEALEKSLFDALQRKAKPEIHALLTQVKSKGVAPMLECLADLNGEGDVLREAQKILSPACDEVHVALENLQNIASMLAQQEPQVTIHFDLAELRGYRYHTDVVFSAYVPGFGQAVAQGGRYDDIGLEFGRARAATGFSLDLRALLAHVEVPFDVSKTVYAPLHDDPQLKISIKELRQQGYRVIVELPGQKGRAEELCCQYRIVNSNNDWVLQEVEKSLHV